MTNREKIRAAKLKTWHVLEIWGKSPETFKNLSDALRAALQASAYWTVSLDGVSTAPSDLIFWRGYFGAAERWKNTLSTLIEVGK